MPPRPANRWWFWAAVALTAAKLWLTGGQTIYAIGSAIHDDKLFAQLAGHLVKGEWLGPYNQFTLAKGPLFPLFVAAVFWTGLPLLLAQQALYAAACALFTRSLRPWVQSAAAQLAVYAVLLLNPMSYDAGNLSRLMRQNIYTPLGLLTLAGLAWLFARRRESCRRQAAPAACAGLALGGFWLTREESVWLLPAVGLLLFGLIASLRHDLRARAATLAVSLTTLLCAALLPVLIISAVNYRHYQWFGTVEFRAAEFKAAYGALTRLKVGPDLNQVPVTRQMREQAYAISPAFARLRPLLEGPVGDHWAEKNLFPAAERQIRGGWFMWAVRDAVVETGLAPDAGSAMKYYQQVADEVNAACDAGRVPARPPRSGFLPPLDASLARPLEDAFLEYGAYFLSFSGFTAESPDSVGDYAELKPFRNLVGTRLSHAPRSPDDAPANQAALNFWKVRTLERLGLTLGRWLTWLGPLILFVGVVRLVESLAVRRVSFPLGLAGALLSACAAYLTINVLVHVTSFYNMSPAAMAAAYPLYLAALVAIVVDATFAWRRPVTTARPRTATAPSRWLWLLPAGTALVVFAARLAEIHAFASDVPYNDQWIIEAEQIIAPWLAGTLHVTDFFRPHFEHLPVLTRLLVWLEVVLTGRWDPLVQMTVNAALHTGFIWLAARWVWQTCSARAAGFVTAVLLLGGALPFAWENIAWGFQSQFPLALLCLFVHVRGACTEPAGSRGWWVAQAAGLLGVFTLASMWLGPLAVIITLLWTKRPPGRWLAAPLAVTILGFGLLALIHSQATSEGSFSEVAGSPLDFVHGFLHLLDWPTGLPGALAVVQLPWIVHALRIRGKSATPPLDLIICALGCWSCAQAGGLAFARTGDLGDYVSRYGDLLFVGTFASALALTRLAPASLRLRPFYLGWAVLWAGLVAGGLFNHSTEGHARYFHQTADHSAELRRTAVQAYLKDGDRRLLDAQETRWVLTQSTDVAARLLDQPAFRALLPAGVNPASAPEAAGQFSRDLQSCWPALLMAGAGLLLAGTVPAVWRGSIVSPPPLAPAQDFWRNRLALVIAFAATGFLFIWADPLTFDQDKRWQEALGGADALENITCTFATPSPFGNERLQGAAPILPPVLRNRFYGTAPAGPELTCTVVSSAFVLPKPWLVVPYAGYPVGDGNGLRLRILDDRNQPVTEIGCNGPNLDGIGFWPADTHAYVGRRAQLVLYDGRTDTQAWVAAAPPIPADSSGLALSLALRLQGEKHASLHLALGIIALIAYGCAFLVWLFRRH
jgi:hypothetical protein